MLDTLSEARIEDRPNNKCVFPAMANLRSLARLSEKDRARIVVLKRQGVEVVHIAERFGVSKDTIFLIVGPSAKRAKRRGTAASEIGNGDSGA